MSTSLEKYNKRRLISSYFSVVLSISLVLFLLGLLGVLVINANRVANHFKEQIPLTVYFKNSTKEPEIKELQQALDTAVYVKSVAYVSKEEAAEKYKAEIGEDFMQFLGYNPLQNSIDLRFKSDYVTKEKIAEVAHQIRANESVSEVSYDEPLVSLLTENVKKIGVWILGLSGVFFLIAILLINSSLRLSVYSKRFIIKTMQMVGATKPFIRRPFILQHIRLGLLGALVALIILMAVLFYIDKTFPELQMTQDKLLLAGLALGVVSGGIIITWLSTFFATQRFLNLKTDDLYY
ncbi:MAG: permease-like cell division protein FtsX [Flavobacteriaceae bacterium]|nr:permease-like cell division protein FtsX [Flavobacteriaceae bacterium]MDZ4148994.1 permease-like cell division protein FtsX [Flavobacteriaceae bacterium]